MRIALILNLLLWSSFYSISQTPSEYSKSAIDLQFKKLVCTGSVLYIAAHPDDENTRLISWLANENCLRTGYLSLTRGDGGQNLIGSEQGVELGVIRTQELLAARRTDGGEQYFTRAYDFGYSKTPKETFEKWTHEEILADVVYVIRKFRPDVIITRFSTDGSGGHGHHTASAILAEEAFDAAADAKRFPEQLNSVGIWQAKRLFYNSAARFWNPNADMSGFIKVNVGGFNQDLGKNYGEIAAESRSMHKSQGFGSAKQRGEIFEYFKPIKGDTNNIKELFQGINISVQTEKNGAKIDKHIIAAKAAFDKNNKSLTTDYLLKAKALLSPTDAGISAYKLAQISKLILAVNGVFWEAICEGNSSITSGDSVKIKATLINRSDTKIWMKDLNILFVESDCRESINDSLKNKSLANNIPLQINFSFEACPNLKTSSLFWLNQGIVNNKFVLYKKEELDRPYGKSTELRAKVIFVINGEELTFYQDVKYKWVDPEKGELYKPIVITPFCLINPMSNLIIASDTTRKELKILIKASKDNVIGILKIFVPNNWKITNSDKGFKEFKNSSISNFLCYQIPFKIKKKNEEKEIRFYFNAPSDESVGRIQFSGIEGKIEFGSDQNDIEQIVSIDGGEASTSDIGIKEIKYDHMPTQTLFPKAEVKLVKVASVSHLKGRKKIAYIPGAGDEVAACLTQLGYEVIILSNEGLAREDLNQYAAIITGVRAYNTNEQLSLLKPKLMEYVNQGGNLIVQYNTNSFAGPFKGDLGPYPFKITRDRVTDETASVTFSLPNHPIFNKPNKINEEDFKGWIQERSIYHGGEMDARYEMPITMNDPSEKPSNGALVIGKYGKGNFIYTGLVFFRELPAGVPGAYRLFVNLIELGK
jgi:LmbE family N-acetylglucosaminyl deacetylase